MVRRRWFTGGQVRAMGQEIIEQAWQSVREWELGSRERPTEIVVTQEEYDVLLRDSLTPGSAYDPVGMEMFGIPLRVIEDTIEEEEERQSVLASFSMTVQSNVAEFQEAMQRVGSAAQLWVDRWVDTDEADIILGLVERLKPEWSVSLDDLNGHALLCQIGSWRCRQMIDLDAVDDPGVWEFLQRKAMLQYADWISEPSTPDEDRFFLASAGLPYRVDPERIVVPEDIPGVTWRDRERWIRELDTVPDEHPHDETGGMSSEELMQAIGMAVDEWKEEEK